MVAATAPAKTSVKLPASVGKLIDQMWALREQRKKLEEEVKAINAQSDAIEEELVARMDAEGVAKSTGSKATVSFSYSVVGNVVGDEGWEKFYEFIAKKKAFFLLQRRVSDGPYKELLVSMNGGNPDQDLLKAKKQIPGVMPFIKKRVNLRTLSS
jgi:hypothetical protein